MSSISKQAIASQVKLALIEDVGLEDVTACLLEEQTAIAKVISRETAVLCGQAWFNEVFNQLDANIKITWQKQDGQMLQENQVICTLEGSNKALLTGERAALNFLQTLSATATVTQHYVNAVKETGVRILDTRKTIPGLRLAQKYAVTCGGGKNHRFGLYDAILIKENHIKMAGSVQLAILQARKHYPELEVQTEVESLDELNDALNAGADRVLLDNFSLDDLSKAVKMKNKLKHKTRLEASGGIELTQLKAIAQTGINDISIGALTKHIKAIDLSMRLT